MPSAIHFFHANGFPIETYGELLNNLEGHLVSPIRILGYNIINVDEGYEAFVDEVIKNGSMTKGEGVAIGHSFGATLSLLAEAKQPGLFKKVILLDPPLFRRTKMIFVSI
jgi:Lysophospholipase